MTSTYLRTRGYAELEAGDAGRARRVLSLREVDVVVLDLGLPDIDGHEVARRPRAAPRTAHIPLIAISGYGHAEDRTRSQQAGFSQHLVKPLSSQSLARAPIETDRARGRQYA